MKAKKGTVLITGATSGIGYDFAAIFAEKGYNLFLASRNLEKLEEIKETVEKKFNVSVKIVAIDLSKAKSAQSVFEETRNQNTDIDILINNAGFGIYGDHIDLDIDAVEAMIQLNITTLTELCTLFGKEMKKRKRGYILNVASTAAYQPLPFVAAYSATKSYVLYFSEALAKELEDYQIVVTCLSPGATKTNFFDTAGIGEKEKGLFANKRRMQSKDVAMIGVNALFSKKLSVISGRKNSILASINKLSSRKMTAAISKKLIQSATRANT